MDDPTTEPNEKETEKEISNEESVSSSESDFGQNSLNEDFNPKNGSIHQNGDHLDPENGSINQNPHFDPENGEINQNCDHFDPKNGEINEKLNSDHFESENGETNEKLDSDHAGMIQNLNSGEVNQNRLNSDHFNSKIEGNHQIIRSQLFPEEINSKIGEINQISQNQSNSDEIHLKIGKIDENCDKTPQKETTSKILPTHSTTNDNIGVKINEINEKLQNIDKIMVRIDKNGIEENESDSDSTSESISISISISNGDEKEPIFVKEEPGGFNPIDLGNLQLNYGDSIGYLGDITSKFGNSIVIQHHSKCATLDVETPLCLEDQTVIGKVFEAFGPVVAPYYRVFFPEFQYKDSPQENKEFDTEPINNEPEQLNRDTKNEIDNGAKESKVIENGPEKLIVDKDNQIQNAAKKQNSVEINSNQNINKIDGTVDMEINTQIDNNSEQNLEIKSNNLNQGTGNLKDDQNDKLNQPEITHTIPQEKKEISNPEPQISSRKPKKPKKRPPKDKLLIDDNLDQETKKKINHFFQIYKNLKVGDKIFYFCSNYKSVIPEEIYTPGYDQEYGEGFDNDFEFSDDEKEREYYKQNKRKNFGETGDTDINQRKRQKTEENEEHPPIRGGMRGHGRRRRGISNRGRQYFEEGSGNEAGTGNFEVKSGNEVGDESENFGGRGTFGGRGIRGRYDGRRGQRYMGRRGHRGRAIHYGEPEELYPQGQQNLDQSQEFIWQNWPRGGRGGRSFNPKRGETSNEGREETFVNDGREGQDQGTVHTLAQPLGTVHTLTQPLGTVHTLAQPLEPQVPDPENKQEI